MPPTFRTSWPHFAWLLLAAVVYHWVGRLVVIAFCFWLLVRGWLWLCYRYPRTMWFVLGFIRGLIGRRR